MSSNPRYRLRLALPQPYRLRLALLSPSRTFAALVLAILTTLSACGGDSPSVACPLLAPGALSILPRGASLPVGAEASGVSSIVGPGGLVAHALWLAAGETATVSAQVAGAGVLFAYGPRNAFGGFPHCSAISQGGRPRVSIAATTSGEYLVLVGAVPGAGTLDYSIAAQCKDGCDDASLDRCVLLADLGCGDLRCDGEIARDARGCHTCTCATGALCGPDRQAGPGGSCVLPACTCEGIPSEPVCGADARTWDSPCAAACAGVPVAREGPCAIACPASIACDQACNGLRAIGADGCPTCTCRPDFAADSASCAACPLELAPVCGSDGVTYPNRCRARCAGARLLYAGACSDSCRTAPPGCSLDCANGLRPVAGGGHCLACACADVPTTCDGAEGPVCAKLPGPVGETTIGSSCLALALGATDGVWGPCGIRCDPSNTDVALACPEGSACQATGFFAGRCLLVEPAACNCSGLVDPVCGSDGTTWDNACVARCAGVDVAHLGACCDAPPTCEGDVLLDTRACPTTCGAAVSADCAANAAFAPACKSDGTPSEGSACSAHARGESAFVEYCP